jgi:hypothetical protein
MCNVAMHLLRTCAASHAMHAQWQHLVVRRFGFLVPWQYEIAGWHGTKAACHRHGTYAVFLPSVRHKQAGYAHRLRLAHNEHAMW